MKTSVPFRATFTRRPRFAQAFYVRFRIGKLEQMFCFTGFSILLIRRSQVRILPGAPLKTAGQRG